MIHVVSSIFEAPSNKINQTKKNMETENHMDTYFCLTIVCGHFYSQHATKIPSCVCIVDSKKKVTKSG